MSEIQKRFGGLLALLNNFSGSDMLAAECYNATEGEIAFTAPKENTPLPPATAVVEIFRINALQGDAEHYNLLINNLEKSGLDRVALWYIDTEQGSYTIVTDPACKNLIGVAKAARTLTDIRREYFLKKEMYEKAGEKPPFDYGAYENTFINRKLIA